MGLVLQTRKSNYRRCSIKKGVLEKLVIFTGRHLCWSLFLTKLEEPNEILQFKWKRLVILTLPASILDKKKRTPWIFIFTLLCGASKGFMKVLKALTKPFEAPKRSAKVKLSVNFDFNTTLWDTRGGKG